MKREKEEKWRQLETRSRGSHWAYMAQNVLVSVALTLIARLVHSFCIPMTSSCRSSAIGPPRFSREYIIQPPSLCCSFAPSFHSITITCAFTFIIHITISWFNSILASFFFSLFALPSRHVPPPMARWQRLVQLLSCGLVHTAL